MPQSVRREIPLSSVPDLLRPQFRGDKNVVDNMRAVDGVYGLLPADHVNVRSRESGGHQIEDRTRANGAQGRVRTYQSSRLNGKYS